MFGKKYESTIAGFGETVLFSLSLPKHIKGDKSIIRFQHGIWVGRDDANNCHIILSEDKQYLSRTVKRLPIQDRFNNNIVDQLLKIQNTLHPDEETDTFEDPDFEDPTNPTDEIDPEQMVITSLEHDVFDIKKHQQGIRELGSN